MAKISDRIARRTKPPCLDRLEPTLECVVQSCQLGLGHLVIRVREDEIDFPVRQSRRRVAGTAAVLYEHTDPEDTSSSAMKERAVAEPNCAG